MNTFKLFTTFIISVFTKKIVHLKPSHNYGHLDEYLNIGDLHYLFVEDDFDLLSINDKHIFNIFDDEPVSIINPHFEDAGDLYNDLICGSNYNWGLDRINQRELPLDCETSHYFGSDDVTVYVLDTGIDISHPWLENSEWGYNFADNNNQDIDGHGTHVAGIIGGLKVGVVQNIKIIAVKVLSDDGFGSSTDIIRGLNWVLQDVQNRNTKGIINMSLGSLKSSYFNDVVETLYDNGIISVVAAGNEDTDACNVSPASAPNAITVGAATSADTEASFSNHGKCVDIYAPGYNIFSSYPVSKGGSESLSGTSMAAPFVAGTIAHMWADNIHLNAEEIVDLLYEESTKNTLGSLSSGSVNRYLYLSHNTRFPWRFVIITVIVLLIIIILSILCCYKCCVPFWKPFCCNKQQQIDSLNNDIENDIQIIELEPGQVFIEDDGI